MKNIQIIALLLLLFTVSCNSNKSKNNETNDTLLLNMVHHNPGEPLFKTQFTQPGFLKNKGYTGQIPKIHIQAALTYDRWKKDIIPEKSPERLWIQRHAAEVQMMINNAEKVNMPLYPFTDMIVVPKIIMDKYGDQMKVDGHISIQRKMTQDILRAQIDEIFWRFPKLSGLTIRFGETYLFDTPYHCGGRPVYSVADHIKFLSILREEVCVKRNKKLFYRTWDWGQPYNKRIDFNPKQYLKVANSVKPHKNLYFSIKHVNGDFLRFKPFNYTIGTGKQQQIVEISLNQAGCYGKNSYPYYLGTGLIDGWPEMKEKKGLRDIINKPQVKGFWTWTWGDSWYGPYFSNELWLKLNEYVIRNYILHPQKTEKEIFYDYALNKLKLTKSDADKLRKLCLLSVNAVALGQQSALISNDSWWLRDQNLTAINLDEVVSKGIEKQIIAEKEGALKKWYEMEKLSKEIHLNNPDDQKFMEVSTTYGRIKYEIVALIWRIQILQSELKAGKKIDNEYAADCISKYENKWQEWVDLKNDNPCCPTLSFDNVVKFTRNAPFIESLNKLKKVIN